MATHRVLKSLGTLALLMIGVGGSSALGADTERPYRKGVVPGSTTIRASFDTEKDSGPDMLLDANEKTRGGKSLVHSWMSPSGLKSEYANSVTLETQRTGTTTTYLAKLPLDGFGVDAAFLRTRAIGFNVIANDDDNDGGGRKGFAFVAKGMGLGTTTPEEWPRVVFE